MSQSEPIVEAGVIGRMREMAAGGATPYSILIELLKTNIDDPGPRRIMAILYFKEAFGLSLGDASVVGAADVFGERLSAADFDREIGPLIEGARERYKP